MTKQDQDAPSRRFELTDGSSHRFWQIAVHGKSHTVSYGRVGNKGRTQTKDFNDEVSARESADRLIRQKEKKGYVSVDVSEKQSSVKAKAEVPEQAVENKDSDLGDSADLPNLAEEVTHEIRLRPQDWFRATFRDHAPLPLEEREFDLESAKRQFKGLTEVNYQYTYHHLDWTPAISEPEARFWWRVLTSNTSRRTSRLKEGEAMAKLTSSLKLTTVNSLLNDWNTPSEAVAPLYRLLGHEAFVSLMLDESKPGRKKRDDVQTKLQIGFTLFILPFLSKKQLEKLRALIDERWSKLSMPKNSHDAFAIEVHLAAALGMHAKVAEVVDAIEDDRYGSPRTNGWQDNVQRPQDLVLGLGDALSVAQHWERLNLAFRTVYQLRGFLACTGTNDLQFAAKVISEDGSKGWCNELVEAFACVEDPAAAAPMLHIVQNGKSPAGARGWLDRFPGNAIHGLVDHTCGRDKLSEAALQYLRDAKRAGHGDLILRAVGNASDEVAAKVRKDVIDRVEKVFAAFDDSNTPDWLATEVAAVAKLKSKNATDWAEPHQLPPITLGDHCLNETQVIAVVRALQHTLMPDQHPLLKALRDHADASSIDAFAWRLFERWLEAGAISKQKWAMSAIGHLGCDQSALNLAPLLRLWPGESQHQRAVHGLECLRAIGSDTALMQLNGIAQKLKFQGLKKKAREFMEQIADSRGMTRSELEDLIVPDLGLSDQGTRTFDFGERSFQFVLKSDLKPAVRDASGKVRADLPKPAAKDDAEVAQASIADWKLLKKQLREAIKIQVPRLEQAMVTGRRWKCDAFESLLVKHPLMINFVKMLLWGGHDPAGKLVDTFRVTDEQDYASREDEPTNLQSFDSVSVIHPYYLSEDEASSWGEVFSDYEIISPFAQLGRKIYKLEDRDARLKQIDSFNDFEIGAMSLVGALDRLGWNRGVPEDAGMFHEHSKPFYGSEITAVLNYESGVPIGYMQDWDDQNLTGCFFLKGIYMPQMYPDHKRAMKLGDVDPVVMSEVMSDLHELKSKAR